MKTTRNLTVIFVAIAGLLIGCNGGGETYTDGSNRNITVKDIKTKLEGTSPLDDAEKRFVAFHVQEFTLAEWAKILSKREEDVRGTDLSMFSSSYWNESILTKAEYQALLAENDGCSVTLLPGTPYVYTYKMPGCTDFNNANKPDIVIPGMTYALHFYNQIAVPADWTTYAGIIIPWQITQLTRLFRESNGTIFFRNERLQRGFELRVGLETEGPSTYEPPYLYSLKSHSPIVLEKVSSGAYNPHYLEEQFVGNISHFYEKDKNHINVNIIRTPRIVSVLRVESSGGGGTQYIWEKPTHIAYQNSTDERIKGYENAAGFFMDRNFGGQYAIFMGLEPAKEYADAKGCGSTTECQNLGSHVLDHVVAHENGHLLMTHNHATDQGHLMYPSVPANLPVAAVGLPFTDNKSQRITQLRFTTAGWTF